MKNILIDSILYNPSIYVYNITENFVTVYNEQDKKVSKTQIKSDITSDKYIIINKERHWLKFMFDLSEKFESNQKLIKRINQMKKVVSYM